MLTKLTPETSPGFTDDVDMGASVAGYAVHKIFQNAGEMTAMVKVLLGPGISVRGLTSLQV